MEKEAELGDGKSSMDNTILDCRQQTTRALQGGIEMGPPGEMGNCHDLKIVPHAFEARRHFFRLANDRRRSLQDWKIVQFQKVWGS